MILLAEETICVRVFFYLVYRSIYL